jgi:peptidoglycan/LPS O-acetylase OafA/YrhL
MGLIRTLLAIAVVVGHAPGWGATTAEIWMFRPLHPYYAVQAFFVISGFYMGVLQDKYQPAGAWVFYTNRYSRLILPYWIVAAVTLGLVLTFPDVPFARARIPELTNPIVFLSNLTMFGQDIGDFLDFYWSAGMLVPQAWSLGSELLFYLLVPLFWRLPTGALVSIVVACVALRVPIIMSDLPFFPWQQRLFPAELVFFVLGMLAHRFRSYLAQLIPARAAWALVCGAIVLIGWFNQSLWWGMSTGIAITLGAVAPAIFAMSRRWPLDRFVGEFSYPIYLWHICIGTFFAPTQHSAVLLVVVSVAASLPMVIFLERPMERWRARRVETARQAAIANSASRASHAQANLPGIA